jgi:hypothetical protein
MFELAVAPLSFEFARLREMIQLHEARVQDAGLTWLRGELMEIARNSWTEVIGLHQNN